MEKEKCYFGIETKTENLVVLPKSKSPSKYQRTLAVDVLISIADLRRSSARSLRSDHLQKPNNNLWGLKIPTMQITIQGQLLHLLPLLKATHLFHHLVQ
ncbi:unnamed protein product [Lactuca virosa]|uniref:Uncharacterized protein n=1 Tax=Lactuca virosa TaxID=75947 RepID=A0AAU9N1V8_9ASTR|nr:unnamed protein product [Lactuca virosa]